MSHDTHHRYEWNAIPWRKLEVKVFKLQRRIYQATTRGETKKAHRLQKLLASSWSAKSLAVRRVTQALAKMALEPEWEAKFEPNSFGFRPGRSCQDAIRQIYNVINLQPRYVLDADIASCFDKIDQAALLEKMATSPFFARPIRQWLKAGVVDQETFMPTQEGTPQGGVLSPLLANIALHGLEDVVKKAGGPVFRRKNGIRIYQNTLCIRYADDFVVFHNTWEGIQRCKETIQAWLKGMGLELKDAKTRYAHTLEAKEECNGNVGFDFLGFTIRQYPVGEYKSKKLYKTIIQPSKNSIEGHYKVLATVIERMKAATPDEGTSSPA